MLIFGHVGLTVAIIYIFQRIRFLRLDPDYRLVVLGSLLPDLIDKPIGYIIFQKFYENGWIYGHTLLFSLIIIIFSYFIATKFLVLGLSSLLHVIEDRVFFFMPNTFLWPLLGWDFSKDMEFVSRWTEYIISSLFSEQYIQITETIGLCIISFLILHHRLYDRYRLSAFLKDGTLNEK